MGLLKDFTGEDNHAAVAAFDRVAEQINTEIARTLEAGAASPDLPFEGQTLAGAALLASGIICPAKEAEGAEALNIKAVWGWWPAVQNGTVRARRYLVTGGRVTESTPPDPDPQEQWLTYHPGQGFVMAPLPQSREGGSLAWRRRKPRPSPIITVSWPRITPGSGRWSGDWAPTGEVIILQSLPHQPPAFQEAAGSTPPDSPLLFSQGLTIYPGPGLSAPRCASTWTTSRTTRRPPRGQCFSPTNPPWP